MNLLRQAARGLLPRTFARLSEAGGGTCEAHQQLLRSNLGIVTRMQQCSNLAAGQPARLLPAAASAATCAGRLPSPPLPAGCSTRARRRPFSSAAALGDDGTTEQPWLQGCSSARLQSLRLVPAPQQGRGLRLAPRPLHALSPAWPQQPGGEEPRNGQYRGYASQPWKFWGLSGSSGDGEGGLRPPEPLPAGIPSASHERELKAVNTAVVVNALIFVAKMCTWAVTGSGCVVCLHFQWYVLQCCARLNCGPAYLALPPWLQRAVGRGPAFCR